MQGTYIVCEGFPLLFLTREWECGRPAGVVTVYTPPIHAPEALKESIGDFEDKNVIYNSPDNV